MDANSLVLNGPLKASRFRQVTISSDWEMRRVVLTQDHFDKGMGGDAHRRGMQKKCNESPLRIITG